MAMKIHVTTRADFEEREQQHIERQVSVGPDVNVSISFLS